MSTPASKVNARNRRSTTRRKAANKGAADAASRPTVARLRNLLAFPALRRGIEVNGEVRDPVAVTSGDARLAGFRDRDGVKLYVEIAGDGDAERADIGALARAAIDLGPDERPRILLQVADGVARNTVVAGLRRAFGEDANIEAIAPVAEAARDAPGRRRVRDGMRLDALDAGFANFADARDDPDDIDARTRARGALADPVVPITTVPTSPALRTSMGLSAPSAGSRRAILENALHEYHVTVANYDVELRRLAANTAPAAQLVAAGRLKRQIQDEATALRLAGTAYLSESRTYRIRKENLAQLGPLFKGTDRSLEAVRAMLVSLKADQDGLDAILRPARNRMILRAFDPLHIGDAVDDGRRVVLGVGSNGAVLASTFTGHGRAELPARFVAGVKWSNGAASEPAVNAGVPTDDPQQANRAVATYRIARALGLDIVPSTAFVTRPDGNGDLELGYALRAVSGTDGQVRVRQTLPPETRFDVATGRYMLSGANAIPGLARKGKFDRWVYEGDGHDPGANVLSGSDLASFMNSHESHAGGEDLALSGARFEPNLLSDTGEPDPSLPAFITVERQTELDYRQAVVQKELADLQVLDVIIGHPDRNPGNYRFEIPANTDSRNPQKQRSVFGVRAIDNDDALGYRWSPLEDGGSITPGLPALVDFHTALRIVATPPADLEAAEGLLSTDDVAGLRERFETVRSELRTKLVNGEFATSAPVSDADRQALAAALGLTRRQIDTLIPPGHQAPWGDATYRANTEVAPGEIGGDSRLIGYLGTAAYRLKAEGGGTPVFDTYG